MAQEIYRLDPWSRTQATLLPLSGLASTPAMIQEDFLRALEHNRPAASARAGGPGNYAATLSLREVDTLKGLTHEEAFRRQLRAALPEALVRPGRRGHPFTDTEVLWPNAVDRPVSMQQYAGANPRAALEKLLLSDRDAHVHTAPRDVFARIHQAVDEVEAISDRIRTKELDVITGHRLIRRRAANVGLGFDDTNEELYVAGRAGSRGSLGRVGTGEIRARLRPLIAASHTSEEIALAQMKEQMAFHADWSWVAARAGQSTAFWTHALERRQEMFSVPTVVREDLARAIRRAVVAGVPSNEIERIVNDAVKGPAGLIEEFGTASAALQAEAGRASRARLSKPAGVFVGFALVCAMIDFGVQYGNRQTDLVDWLGSVHGVELASRTGTVGIAIMAAHTVQRRAFERAEAAAAKRVGIPIVEKGAVVSPLAALRSGSGRFIGIGLANAIFIVGEGLIAVYRGESGTEIAGQMAETALVIAIAEGSVAAAEYLFAGEIGSFGGPIGMGISIGTVAVYEGIKYLWTFRQHRDADVRMFLAKCEAARAKMDLWAKTMGRELDANLLYHGAQH
jgi:hypothetical protein